jgi:hypothetical protein
MEVYLTKPDAKAVGSSFGTRVGSDGTLSRALNSLKEKIARWTPSRGVIPEAVGS